MRRGLLLGVFMCGWVSVGAAQTDVMVKVKTVITASPSSANVESPSLVTSVYYAHGKMRRRDRIDRSGAIVMTSITDCEKNTGLLIDPVAREYRSFRPAHVWSDQELQDYKSNHPKDTVRIESRTIDTGERKILFGLQAKHLVTTNERAGSTAKETTDAWYVDRESVGELCRFPGNSLPMHYVVETLLATYPEIADVHHTGPMPVGLAISLTFTQTGSGSKSDKTERTVEEFSEASLQDALFELPTGLRENPNLLKVRASTPIRAADGRQ